MEAAFPGFEKVLGPEEGFTKYDSETGYPLLDKEGQELTKSKKKKLDKFYSKYVEKWEKQMQKLNNI